MYAIFLPRPSRIPSIAGHEVPIQTKDDFSGAHIHMCRKIRRRKADCPKYDPDDIKTRGKKGHSKQQHVTKAEEDPGGARCI